MDGTRISFLHSLQGGGQNAWTQMDRAYRPLIINWLRKYDLSHDDAEDVAQEVLLVVSRKISGFDHSGRLGAFRAWLRALTISVVGKHFRKSNREAKAKGSTSILEMLQQLQDPNSETTREFERQHDEFLLKALLKNAETQFEPKTMETFRLHVLQGLSAKETAQRMNIAVHTVYVQKSRVLHNLREQAANWASELHMA